MIIKRLSKKELLDSKNKVLFSELSNHFALILSYFTDLFLNIISITNISVLLGFTEKE